jgi:hypothetical protein
MKMAMKLIRRAPSFLVSVKVEPLISPPFQLIQKPKKMS